MPCLNCERIPEVIQMEHAPNDSFISSRALCKKEHADQDKNQGKKEKGKVPQNRKQRDEFANPNCQNKADPVDEMHESKLCMLY